MDSEKKETPRKNGGMLETDVISEEFTKSPN